MGFLAGKRILVTGVLSNRSIAYGIARACHQQGAELAFTYVGDRFKERVAEFAAEFGSKIVLPCDVAEDSQIEATFAELGATGTAWTAWCTPSVSPRAKPSPATSWTACRAKHSAWRTTFRPTASPPWPGRPAADAGPQRLGADADLPGRRARGSQLQHHGPGQASLEASVRYLATALGPRGIRANGISAGPIKTLAASGIKDFSAILKFVEAQAPLRRNVTIEDVGNVAAFLLSDLAAGVTGEITTWTPVSRPSSRAWKTEHFLQAAPAHSALAAVHGLISSAGPPVSADRFPLPAPCSGL